MAVHAYHEGLAGHHAANVLHDGCDECEQRAGAGLDGLMHLDESNFHALMDRMVRAEFDDEGYPETISRADRELCRTLYLLAVLLERHFSITPADLSRPAPVLHFPNTPTGPVGDTAPPVRMVTLNDARVITAALEGYVTLVDKLHDTLETAPLDADVRDRLERVILELDAPPA